MYGSDGEILGWIRIHAWYSMNYEEICRRLRCTRQRFGLQLVSQEKIEIVVWNNWGVPE